MTHTDGTPGPEGHTDSSPSTDGHGGTSLGLPVDEERVARERLEAKLDRVLEILTCPDCRAALAVPTPAPAVETQTH